MIVVNSPYDATVKACKVPTEYDADLVVFVVGNEYDATNDGNWFYTDNSYNATTKLFWTDNNYDADLKVWFTDNQYNAGWRRSHPLHNRL